MLEEETGYELEEAPIPDQGLGGVCPPSWIRHRTLGMADDKSVSDYAFHQFTSAAKARKVLVKTHMQARAWMRVAILPGFV